MLERYRSQQRLELPDEDDSDLATVCRAMLLLIDGKSLPEAHRTASADFEFRPLLLLTVALGFAAERRFQLALETLRQCVMLDTEFGEAHWQIAHVIEQWRSEDAPMPEVSDLQRSSLRELLRIEPRHVQGHLLMASIEQENAENKRAFHLAAAAREAVRLQEELLGALF